MVESPVNPTIVEATATTNCLRVISVSRSVSNLSTAEPNYLAYVYCNISYSIL
jgi:hypothetical protein